MLVDHQVAEAEAQRSGVVLHALADGTGIVSFEARLVQGWNRTLTQISFLLPPPYPAAQPDCFYADADLRLASGSMPANSGIQSLNGVQRLWFSWHLAEWLPQRDDLLTYIRFVESRLHDPR